MELHGRRKIYTAVEQITAENVISEVNKALALHIVNAQEMDYLYWYRRGVQPILNRVKEIRPEINNKVVMNDAAMVVTFKNGYFLTKPTSFVSRREDDATSKKVKQFAEWAYVAGKADADNDVVDWFHTVGVGSLYIEPNKDLDKAERPYKVYATDPRSTFCVYSLRPGNKVVYGVNMVLNDKKVVVDVITPNKIYRCSGLMTTDTVTTTTKTTPIVTSLDGEEPNVVGDVPIVEYQYNSGRMASFEAAIPIMDARNLAQSNRLDAVEQTVQNLMVLYNCELPEGENANTIRQNGLIVLQSTGDNKADVKLMSETLDQNQTQTTIKDLYDQMLEKCGVPSAVHNAGSTSDNVGAVYLRNGWAQADTDARNTEDQYRKSNNRFVEIVLKILKKANGFSISPADMDVAFIRNDMTNLLVKTQAALNMKELGFAPELTFERSGLSNDPIVDVERSRKYIDAAWDDGSKTEDPTNQMGGNIVKSYVRGDRSQ